MAGKWSRWGLVPLVVLMSMAVPTGASAAAPKPIRSACALKSDGMLRFVAKAGDCRRAERAIRFSAAKPVIACARRGAGVHVVRRESACARGANRPSLVLELPSGEKHDFCAHKRTGRLRSTEHVPYPGQGGAGGGGEHPARGKKQRRGPCKRSERRVVLGAVDFAPDTEEDVATVSAGGAAAIDVLANDRDPEGGAITVAGVDRGAATGDVTVAADARTVAYDPAGRFRALGAGASATERFTYTATDGKRASAPTDVTVTVTGVNDAPIAVADSAATTEDAPLVLRPAANDTDPDTGDAVIAAAADGPGVTRNADGTVTYDPTRRLDHLTVGEQHTDRIAYTASDGRGGTAAGEIVVTVTGVNDAPAATTSPGSATFTEGAAPVAVDPALALADPDSAQLAGATVTIGAGFDTSDALAFTPQAGITGSYDMGVLTLTGSATVAAYEAVLRTVTFIAAGPNPSAAARTIAFRVADAAGPGAPASRAVAVSTVNDAPTLTTSGGTVAYTEDDAPTAVDAALAVADPDSPQLAGATVRITTGFVTGQDVLAFTPQPGITGSYAPLTGTLTLTGAAAPSAYQAALRSVTYVNTSDAPSSAERTIELRVDDGADPSAIASRAVAVTAVNDAPVVTTSAGSATFVEGGSSVAVDPALTLADADSAMLSGAEVEITAATRHADDDLDWTGFGWITNGTYADGVLTITGAATVAEYETLLRSVRFSNPTDTPGLTTRSVRFRATDADSATSSFAARDVAVSDTNAAPEVTTTAGSAAFTEDGGAVTVDGGVTVIDADSPELAGATVQITGNHDAADELLFADQNGITGSYAGGTLTLTGSATVAQYQAALRDVTFDNGDDTPATAARTVTFQVDDGAAANHASNSATRGLTVAAADDAPVAVDDAATLAEDAAATAVGVLANDTDVDGGPMSIAGKTDGSDGTVAITGGGTGVTYEPDADFCGTDTFTYTLNGGSGATVTVTVTCADDAPAAVDDAATVGEDDAATAIPVLANDTDVDGGAKAITAVTQGADGAVAVTGGGTGLTYAPDADWCGTDTFTYTITGGDAATVTVTVTCVDDLPVAVDDAATIAEDAGATAVGVLANDTDIDAGPKTVDARTNGGHGTVAITGGGTGLTYAPDADWCGTDTFTYTLNGGDAATVTMTVTCVNDAPVADDESFSGAIGNTTLVVDDPSDGAPSATGPRKTISGDLLAGDTDAETPGALSITPVTKATAQGGSVTIEADGDFTFLPAAGHEGSDSFDYTVSDGDLGDTGTVTITVADSVWYVDDSAAPGGDGRSTAPYDALAPLGGSDPDGSGDTIFLYQGSYADALGLEASQRLVSERHGLVVDGTTLVPAAAVPSATLGGTLTLGAGNTIQGVSVNVAGAAALAGAGVGAATMNTVTPGTLTGAPAVNINGGTLDMEFASVTSAGSAGHGIALTNTDGEFVASGGAISNAALADVMLSGGAVDFTYGGTVNDASDVAVQIGSSTGGTKDFNGAITGGRVTLSSNTGATIRFDGGVALNANTQAALNATGGGTVAVTGGANTLQATSAAALTVANTTIHGDGLTFRSIGSSSSPTNGIALTNTGAGRLTVTGTGAADSGGTIQSATGAGVALATVPGGVSLTRVRVMNNGGDGLQGTTVGGLVLESSSVTGNGNAVGEHGLDFAELTGTVNLTTDTVTGNFDRNVSVVNGTGTVTMTVSGGSYGETNDVSGSDSIAVEGTGGGTITLSVQNATFTNSQDDHIQVSTDASTNVLQNVTIANNAMGNPIGEPGGGITLDPGGNAVMKAFVQNNTIQGARTEAITVSTPGSRLSPQPVTIDASIIGNTIGAAGVVGSGASAGNGIGVRSRGNAVVRTLVENNAIVQYANLAGLHLLANDGNGTLDATVRNNTISSPVAPDGQNAILAVAGSSDLADTAVACLNLGDAAAPLMNQLFSGGSEAPGGEDIRIRKRAATTIKLPGYSGAPTDQTAVASFVQARNAKGGSPTVAARYEDSGGGFIGAAFCNLPQL